MGQLIVSRPSKWGGLLTGVAAGVFVSIDLENFGPRSANAFEWSQLEIKTKSSGSSRETTSFKGQVSGTDWLNIKFDGSSLDLNRRRVDPFTSYGFNSLEPVQKEKGTVSDTRVTLGLWDDWVRFTSRQAVSSYIPPGTDLSNIRQTDAGVGFDNGATSQHIESNIWKTGTTRVALFAGYARAGASFLAPENVIKRDDLFSKPNTTTTRLGGTVEQGPIALTLEQRDVQSLLQNNAPILVKNQIGVSLSFDQLMGRDVGIPKGLSWVVPASAYFNIAQGKVSASLSQGVNGDTTFDVSAGLTWSIEKIHVNLGYWQSDYNSQLYPWKGSGINGSLGFYEGPWGMDLYFDVSRSRNLLQQLTSQTLDAPYVTSGVRFYSSF